MRPRIKHRVVDDVELKRCCRCKQWLPLESFCKGSSMWDSLNRYCRDCWSVKMGHASRQPHYEHRVLDGAELKLCSRCKRWLCLGNFSRNCGTQDGLNCHCRSCAGDNDRDWREENPERVRYNGCRYRARKYNAQGADTTSVEMVRTKWSLHGNLCYLCNRPAEATDHVEPLAKGGSHMIDNLMPVCGACNSVKGDRWPYDIEAHRQREGYYQRKEDTL